jgi:hypothetical protein
MDKQTQQGAAQYPEEGPRVVAIADTCERHER